MIYLTLFIDDGRDSELMKWRTSMLAAEMEDVHLQIVPDEGKGLPCLVIETNEGVQNVVLGDIPTRKLETILKGVYNEG